MKWWQNVDVQVLSGKGEGSEEDDGIFEETKKINVRKGVGQIKNKLIQLLREEVIKEMSGK